MRVLREAPAPSDEQAKEVGAFVGQLAALQCAFNDYKESAFLVDEESDRTKKKEKKKKKKRKKKKDDESRSRHSKHRSESQGRSKLTVDQKVITNANIARRTNHMR